MKHFILLAALLVLFGPGILHAQFAVSGTITDAATGEALPMVNIVIKGESRGTTSDLDGNYRIELSEEQFTNTTLVFSFIGYRKREVAVLSRSNIDVTLEVEQLMLDEAVVTAIGIKKEKKRIGYAITEVGEKELERSGEVNMMDALNAKVAGVNVTSSAGTPGASSTVRIRGNNSISGNNAPLYVIDGIPIDDSFRGSNFTDQANRAIDINPDDIESITVLKGGSASALYGVRAGNGAVIITTKKGSGQTRITLKSSYFVDQVNQLPQTQRRFGQGENGNFVEGTRFSWGPEIEGQAYDHGANFFQNGTTLNNYFSLEGGSGPSTFMMAIGDTRQSGIVPNTGYNRTNLRLSGSSSWRDRLFVQSNINFISSGADRGQRGSNLSGVMLGLMRAPADFDLTNGVDDPVNDPTAWSHPDGSQRTYHNVYDNPFWSVNRNQSREDVERVIASFETRLNINENLDIVNRVSMDYYDQRTKSFWDSRSAEYRDLGGRVFNANTVQRNFNNDFYILYNQNFGEKWEITGTFGHNYFNFNTTDLELDGVGFIIPGFYDISNVDIINVIADDYITRERGVGVYGDLNIGYNDYLFVGLTGRNDWLSNLPANNNSFFYPSANVGFIFSDAFDLQKGIFDYGKIRGSYANVGNGAPGVYLTSNFFTATTPVQGQLGFRPNSTIGNPDLRPENTTTIEVGTDLRFFQNRFGIDLTWYRTETYDPIIVSFIPASSGYVTSVLNGDGPIRNTGIELMLTGKVIEAENFNQLGWESGFNFTRYRSLVVSIAEDLNELPLSSAGLASTQSTVVSGQPYGVLMGTAWARDDAGNILVDDNGYPLVDPERQVVGDPNPNFTFGWRNTLTWRNWTMSMLADVRIGGDLFNGTANVMRFHGTHIDTENRDETIVFDGVNVNTGEANTQEIALDQAYYTRYGLVGVSETGIENVNWFRLRDFSLMWRMNKEMAKRLKVESASIGLVTRNLILVTNYTGIDPETSLSGASNSFGRDYFNTPNTRSIGIQLNLTL